jgi:hypothetical protein
MSDDEERRRNTSFQPSLATPAEVAAEPRPFPQRSKDDSEEVFYDDWRLRLERNLSRRSDGRWDPLSYWR